MSDKSGRIPAGELSAYERWELPNLEGNQRTFNRTHSASASKSVKPLTAADIEEIRQQAWQAGFEEGKVAGQASGHKEGFETGKQEGRAEGKQQGIEAGQQQIQQNIDQLKLLMTRLVDPISEQQKIIEQATLNIALAISRSVIYRELKYDSSSIQPALSTIFHGLPKCDRELKVKLNPADMKHVQAATRQLSLEAELISDPSISAGGCIVETSSQLIDYTIEKRFQKTVHSMLLKASQGDTSHGSLETSSTINEHSEYPADILEEAEEENSRSGENRSEELGTGSENRADTGSGERGAGNENSGSGKVEGDDDSA